MKMTKSLSLVLLGVMIVSAAISGSISNTNNTPTSKITQNQSLTIYTYKGLMNNPYYDIAGNFSSYAGINKDKINIVTFPDAYALMNELVKEGSSPKADVVIGLDNALVNLFNTTKIFEPYQNQTVLKNLNPVLISNMGPVNNIIPYDYGLISLNYDSSRINSSTYSFLSNFTLDNLISSNLASKIVLENPETSTLGLGFLLWTIGTYGDLSTGVFLHGFLSQNFHTFWKQIGKNFTLAPNYDSAYKIFSDPAKDKPMIVSLTTTQAQEYCQNHTTTTKSLITSFVNGTQLNQSTWFQIEGLGIVKNSPNQDLANKFMGWFLSTDIQNKIAESNWMYPANTKATIPACFNESGIPNPKKVVEINNYVNPSSLKYFLSAWLSQWSSIVTPKGLPGFSFQTIAIFFPFFIILAIYRKKRQF